MDYNMCDGNLLSLPSMRTARRTKSYSGSREDLRNPDEQQKEQRRKRSWFGSNRSRSCDERSDRTASPERRQLCLHCQLLTQSWNEEQKVQAQKFIQMFAVDALKMASGDPSRSRPKLSQIRKLSRESANPDIVVSSVSDEDESSLGFGSMSSIPSTPSSACSNNSSIEDSSFTFDIAETINPKLSLGSIQNVPTVTVTSESPPQEIISISEVKIEIDEFGESPNEQFLHPHRSPYVAPRSSSIDVSTLQHDIKNFLAAQVSTESDDSDSDCYLSCGDLRRMDRCMSYEPIGSPEAAIHTQSSRLQHLTDLFRRALAKSPMVKRNAEFMVTESNRGINKHRTSRYWFEPQNPGDHLWLPSQASTANSTECYIGETDCTHNGEKRRCAACHIVAHTGCFHLLTKMNLFCKPTYRDSSSKFAAKDIHYDHTMKHHWVHRWRQDGRCATCAKSFQQKLFKEKEVIAITCSWCKVTYHNKQGCFSMEQVEQECDRGSLRDLIVPPSWVIRMQNQSRKTTTSSLAGRKITATGAAVARKQKRKNRSFVVKSVGPSVSVPKIPLLIFVNPKSGGNKGAKLLNTFCWLLNPRQVYDITTMKGPKYGLEMYRKIASRLRILVCGGDGTVGWVLATLDTLNWTPYPPIAVMPLGTGNDLARALGWGGTFMDEPMTELLTAVAQDTVVHELDRWKLEVTPNYDAETSEVDENAVGQLPLTVMNNYFSIGADAHVALQFHHQRTANPQMFNSRFKNRLVYGGIGTVDLFRRSWKDLADYITIECDGIDITQKLRQQRFHCILFLNIPFYAGGTNPWGTGGSTTPDSVNADSTPSNRRGSGTFSRPSCSDGLIEIIGFTAATLAAIQIGGRGERIAQAGSIRIVTSKPIPAQVDGEPCLLASSIVYLEFHSKVPMLQRVNGPRTTIRTPLRRPSAWHPRTTAEASTCTSIWLKMPVVVVSKHDYDTHREDVDRLKEVAFEIGQIDVEIEAELDHLRKVVNRMIIEQQYLPYSPSAEWKFLDYVTNAEEGTFRVPRNQESFYSVSDICCLDECLMILDTNFPSTFGKDQANGTTEFLIVQHRASKTRNQRRRRKLSEVLRVVLSSDGKETLL